MTRAIGIGVGASFRSQGGSAPPAEPVATDIYRASFLMAPPASDPIDGRLPDVVNNGNAFAPIGTGAQYFDPPGKMSMIGAFGMTGGAVIDSARGVDFRKGFIGTMSSGGGIAVVRFDTLMVAPGANNDRASVQYYWSGFEKRCNIFYTIGGVTTVLDDFLVSISSAGQVVTGEIEKFDGQITWRTSGPHGSTEDTIADPGIGVGTYDTYAIRPNDVNMFYDEVYAQGLSL